MKLHPDLQAVVDNVLVEHSFAVSKSVEFGLILGCFTAATAFTTTDNLTPAEERSLQEFVVAHLGALSEMYDIALGLTDDERKLTEQIVKDSAHIVFDLMGKGMNEIVTIN